MLQDKQVFFLVSSEETLNFDNVARDDNSIIKNLKDMGIFVGPQTNKGTYGCVHTCYLKTTTEEYETAILKIQTFELDNDDDEECIEAFIGRISNEISIMLHLEGLNLSPRVYGYYYFYSQLEKKISSVIIMEKLGVVEDFLISSPRVGELKDSELVDICNRATLLIDKLSDSGIVHCDYKWNNIGYRGNRESFTLIPFDFGLSHFTDDGEDVRNIDKYKLMQSCFYYDDVFGIEDLRLMINTILSSYTGNETSHTTDTYIIDRYSIDHNSDKVKRELSLASGASSDVFTSILYGKYLSSLHEFYNNHPSLPR